MLTIFEQKDAQWRQGDVYSSVIALVVSALLFGLLFVVPWVVGLIRIIRWLF